jgi:signal transduction histidine kinase/DNA-binding response OmpR family regulator/HPt (histidine-containing phosphotransfer) domain-containing protein
MKVLLVEDNPGDARLLREIFKDGFSSNAKMTHVESMSAVEKHVADHAFDIIVLDLGLPDAQGLGALRRARVAAPHLPLVVLTGLDDELLALQALQEGAQDYLVKGQIETHGLLRAMRYAIARKAMEVKISNDLAVLKRAEGELRESELMLRLALDVSDQGVWRWEVGQTLHGFEMDAHCRALFSLASDTPVGYAAWASAIWAEDRMLAETGLANALDPAHTLDEYVCDYRVVRPSGAVSWIAAAGRAVFEPDLTEPTLRRAIRILGTMRDVSQAKHAEHERDLHQRELERSNAELERLADDLGQARQAADQANQAKSRFLAGITHELRTPLHGILGYAKLLSLEGGLNPTQSERLRAMMAAGQYLLGTINAVLDMSQIEAEQLDLRPVEIELPDLVRSCLDVVRPAAEAKGLALVLTPAAPLSLFADPTRLRQVLINLLGNAVKFTPGGAIKVQLRPTEAGKCVRFEVADTGPGVPTRYRDKLFQTFERVNADAVNGIEGTGLGLAIAARLVQMMGGRIGYADNPGGGSVFWLELPVGSMRSPGVDAAGRSSLAESSPLRVLVVDDEALNRNIAKGFLSLAGHEVVCLDNGAAAVKAAAGGNFDVILMDVRMPGMDGLESTRRIRALPAPRGKVRVVAVTAQAFAQQIEICRQAGMDSHISKPFTQAVLLAALENTAPSHTKPAVMPLAAAPGDTGPELPILDRAAFEEITEYLAAADLEESLEILITRGEELLCWLQMPGMLSQASLVAEAAHKLAGGAGTFGFLSVAAAARRFEDAADMNAAETVALGDHLAAAIKASITVIRQELVTMATIAR